MTDHRASTPAAGAQHPVPARSSAMSWHTFLFTDLVSSTEQWDRAPTQMTAALRHHDEILESVISRHGGRRVKHTGDGLMAVFDDPVAGVRAAVESQRGLMAVDWDPAATISARMGLHCGPASERAGDFFGTSPNRCARITGLAHGGQILISEDLARTIGAGLEPEGIGLRALGAHTLRGLSRPEHIHQITASGLPAEYPRLGGVRLLTELPRPTTALIGREHELASTLSSLETASLVTLIGPGGVGKTRLAAHVARRLDELGERPVGYVDLLPAYPTIVDHTIAAALGVGRLGDEHPIDAITRLLRDSDAVLILDNAEHVLAALSAFIEQLAARCRDVSLLVTSQAPLGLPGERVAAVNPLPTVPGGAAHQLFVDRATEIDPEFDPAGHEDTIDELCATLDGLPLAVELAAARIRSLTPEEILERIHHRLRFLQLPEGHPRARRSGGLGDVIEWSHDLLDETEQLGFARLGAFRGGFTLRAAEEVLGFPPLEDWEVSAVLDRLVQRSLLQAERRGPTTTYRMLESIRTYAEMRLHESGQENESRDRHADYFLAALESLDPADPETADAFDLRSDNIRAAISWTAATRTASTARLLLTKYRALTALGFQEDAQVWFQLVVDRGDGADQDRPMLLQRLGQLAMATAVGLPEGRAALEEALRLAAADGDSERVVAAHLHLATMLSLYPASLDLDAAERHIAALETLIPAGSLPFVEARMHNCAAMLHLFRRESAPGVDRARRAGAAAAAGGIEFLQVNARTFEGANLAYGGQLTDGLALMEAAWADAVEAGFDFMASTTAWMRGYASVLLADPVDAARWFRRELASGRPDAHPAVRRSLEANLGIALLLVGELDEARTIADGTVSVNGTLLEPLLAFVRSDFDRADATADDLLADLERMGDRNEYAAVAYWSGRFDNIAGRVDRARDLLHASLEIAVAEPACPYYEVPVRAELAMLGEPGHLESIVEANATLPLRGLEARVRLAQAVTGPPDEAEARFAEALAVSAAHRLAIDRVEILVRRAAHRARVGDRAGFDDDRTRVRSMLEAAHLDAEWAHLDVGAP